MMIKGGEIINLVDKAYTFAKAKHDATGKQYNGKPYFIHPKATAKILKAVTKDEEIIAAGYLHDILEDTKTSYTELVREFGKRVASMVKEVTKDKNKDFPNIKTDGGLMVKVADRLANVSSATTNQDKEKKAKLFKKYSFCFIHEGTHLKNG